MKTRPATANDAHAITDIHMRCLPFAVSDFSLLGRAVVERFYKNTIARGLGA